MLNVEKQGKETRLELLGMRVVYNGNGKLKVCCGLCGAEATALTAACHWKCGCGQVLLWSRDTFVPYGQA